MQSFPKSLFIFVFCVPLAIVLGVMLATPLDQTTMILVLSGFLLLLTPFFLTGHHTFLILSWNAYINAFFLPGKPYIWMLTTLVSVFFLLLTITLNRGKIKVLSVPSVAWPLLTIGLISFITCQLTGGVGAQALGSEVYGGKRYAFIWFAIAGYFALSALPVDPARRQFLAGAFFLVSVTAAVSNMAFMLGESFYFLFLLFPVEWAMTQAVSESMIGGFSRVGGLGPASVAVVSYMLLRYGIRGTFSLRYPWRSVIFLLAFAAGLFSGFRAVFVSAGLLFIFQFIAEGLYKTKYLVLFTVALILGAIILLPMATRLPLSVQRCLTLLPLDLDRAAIEAARASTDWRIEMWRSIIPDIPNYFWLGKGYAIDPKDIYFSQMHISLKYIAPFEAALVAGDYHSGPLTLIIPFGIWGVLAFIWFCFSSLRVLWLNFKYGDPEIKNINTFLLVAFWAQLAYYLFVFGAFYMDLAKFVGLVGLSICINHGVASRAGAPALVPKPSIVPPSTPDPEVAGGGLQPA
jgi:hypothetical protein